MLHYMNLYAICFLKVRKELHKMFAMVNPKECDYHEREL